MRTTKTREISKKLGESVAGKCKRNHTLDGCWASSPFTQWNLCRCDILNEDGLSD